VLESENYKVFQGSNLDVLPTLPDNSVDAIVTDPPYELGFMGKSWDSSGIAYSVELWRECLRVLKPGGHLLAFSGSRTYHRMVVAIEDSGFEIRDMVSWISNKTFPKSMDVSKAIDKAAGDNSDKWAGWGTALKPTVEPIVLARKPLDGTVASNVLTWGVGGLNIDASRIGTEERLNSSAGNKDREAWRMNTSESEGRIATGRWPANVILDEEAATIVDEQSGQTKSPKTYVRRSDSGGNTSFHNIGEVAGTVSLNYGDEGGASRFFYVARASKNDRNEGLDSLPKCFAPKLNGGDFVAYGRQASQSTVEIQNFHPTVKPTSLMTYLIKLIAPEGSTILDPFTGSGSTGKAALLNGYKFIGIELTEEYLPIIKGRLDHAEETYKQTKEEESGTLF
jgi:site-specific DNA-methyltransferase (adenine-specific)